MASVRRTVTLPLAFVVCVLAVAGVAATPAVAAGKSLAAAPPQDASTVEVALALDRSARRLIQQGLRNQGFDPGTPDGLFGPRTRAAIREWQESRGAASTGYLTGAEAEFLRAATLPPPAAREADPTAAPTPTVTENTPQDPPGTGAEPDTRAPAATTNARLPPEIMADRLLVRAERLLADDDPGAALEAMNEMLALQEQHDLVLGDNFRFRYAQVAFDVGRTETAIASLNVYLVTAGRVAEYYREALELLDSAEVRLLREEEDRRRAEARFRDCDACPEMVVLPGGNLALGRYEVTVDEYRAFAAASGGGAGAGCLASREGLSWRDPGFPQTDRHPVTCMSVEDAEAYVSWLSQTSGKAYRLPTRAELARGSVGSQPGCYQNRTGRDGTCRVGTYGSNALGLSGMLGNVAEWASDCWEGDCGRRVTHGGGWIDPPRFLVRNRVGRPIRTDSRFTSSGFRVARTLESAARSRPDTHTSPVPTNAQLPADILIDRHLARVERLLAADDPETALEVMDELILALQEEYDLVLPNDLHFRYAEVAFASGQTRMAIASLSDYLVAAGSDGEFYREALELLDSAEVRLEREEAERTRGARWPPGHVFRDCELCPEMVVMPGSLLALGRYETTVAEYRAFASVTDGGPRDCINGSWRNPGYPQTDRHPVVCLSWLDVQEYLSWLSQRAGAPYRLPTEEEWARAAAGSQPGCHYNRTGRREACTVGSYDANAAGVFDMAANILEWPADCSGNSCVRRGGSWWYSGELLRPDTRDSDPATRRSDGIGFRLARPLE